MKNKLIVLLIILAGMSFSAALAQPALDASVISSGGTVSPALIDIKGQAVIGASQDGSIQLGGLYTLIGGGPGPVVNGPPGTVPLTISRSGNDILLTWASGLTIAVEIYAMVGDGTGQFSNDFPATPIASINPGTNTYTDPGQIGAGGDPEKYYKAVFQGYAGTDLNTIDPANYPEIGTTCLKAAWAVGKVNKTFKVGDLLLVSIPLIDSNASQIFPPQIPASNKLILHPRVGMGLSPKEVTPSGLSGQDFMIGPTIGLWVESPDTNTTDIVITFAGALLNSYEKDLDPLDLTGNPLPAGLSSANLGGLDQDIIHLQVGKGLRPILNNQEAWDSAFDLKLGAGFWYETSAGTRKWNIDMRNLDAKIR